MKLLSNVQWDYTPPEGYEPGPNALDGMDKPHIQLTDLETAHGYAVVSWWKDKCYWGLQDWDGIQWVEIGMSLFVVLVMHQRGELKPVPEDT